VEAGSYDLSVSNEELLIRLRNGDQEALRTLFRRHERPVYALLYRMLSNREDAEEALADVFVKVWRAASRFRGEAKFSTWLYRIASNTATDALRARRGHHTVSFEELAKWEAEALMADESPADDPAEAAVRSEERAMIMLALQKLRPDDRLLVTLYHLQECSYGELSEITKVPVGNLKVRLFRARRRLRQLYEEVSAETEAARSSRKEGCEDEMRTDTGESVGIQPPAVELP